MRIPDRIFVLTGWWLFVVSAGFFMIASWRAADMISFIGAAPPPPPPKVTLQP